MDSDDDLVTEINVSSNFTSVFFTEQEARSFLDSLLNADGSPPEDLNIVFWRKKLLSPKTRREVKTATPEQLKEWTGYKG